MMEESSDNDALRVAVNILNELKEETNYNDFQDLAGAAEEQIATGQQKDEDEFVLFIKDTKDALNFKIEILEEQEIYGDFKVIQITERTSSKERKELAGIFEVYQFNLHSEAEKIAGSSREQSLSYDIDDWSYNHHLRLYLKLFASNRSNITPTFLEQEKVLKSELLRCKKRRVDLKTVPLTDHYYPENDTINVELSLDTYHRLQPLEWLSVVNIDLFSRKLMEFHDNYYINKGCVPPKIKIISSSVFCRACIDESSEKKATKKKRICEEGSKKSVATVTKVCYDHARWFPGQRDTTEDPLRFKVDEDRVFIPFNRRDNHWALLYIYGPDKIMYYFDSLWTDGSPTLRTMLFFLSKMAANGKDCEDLAPWLRDFNPLEWTLVDLGGCRADIVPQQNNGCDCGVYVCIFMTYLICMPLPYLILCDDDLDENGQFMFQTSIVEFRRKMQRLLFDRTIKRVTTIIEFLENC
jgi:hypothetical protein